MINAGLAAGAALAALPVILHLFMRQTPKHVIFPALRLVRERQKRSKKRLRVKNWLLLLARMAVLALMALALARPRLYSQMPLGDQSVPTALGLVFDTSLSMSYKEKDKTRLDEAKERALAILDQIPDSSLVFPVNSADPVAPYGLTPAAARQWIDNLTIRPVNRPLNSAMGQVYPKVVECDRPRHEVYVLTDLARSSWNPEQPAEGLDRVAKAKTTPGGKIATFILRLGSHEVNDVAIDAAAPAKNFVTQGESVEIKGQVRAQGAKPASRVVEFYLDGVKKGEKPVEIPPGGQVEVSFATPTRLPEGEVHRGELRLGGTPDPLEFNDKRYFTFKVRPAYKVLLISDQPGDADFVAFALDPDPSPSASSGFQIDRVRPRSCWRSIATRSKTMPRSSCSTSRPSRTRIPGACSTPMCTRAGGWSSGWATAATPITTTARRQARFCPPSSSPTDQPRAKPPSARSRTSRIPFFNVMPRRSIPSLPWCPFTATGLSSRRKVRASS